MPTTRIETKKILPRAEEGTPAILPTHRVSDVVMTSGLGPGLRGWGARHEEEEQGAACGQQLTVFIAREWEERDNRTNKRGHLWRSQMCEGWSLRVK